MSEGRDFEVGRQGLEAFTRGLSFRGHPELKAQVASPDLLGEAEAFLCFVGDYVAREGATIRSGETLRYGY
jgi:hypothetical protein